MAATLAFLGIALALITVVVVGWRRYRFSKQRNKMFRQIEIIRSNDRREP